MSLSNNVRIGVHFQIFRFYSLSELADVSFISLHRFGSGLSFCGAAEGSAYFPMGEMVTGRRKLLVCQEETLHGVRGVQQGSPLGPLFFAFALQEVLVELRPLLMMHLGKHGTWACRWAEAPTSRRPSKRRRESGKILRTSRGP